MKKVVGGDKKMVRCKENISKGYRVTNGFGNKIFRRTLPFLMIGTILIGIFSVVGTPIETREERC